jgi:3-methyladenine DNA glycosylase/8-oxoguanine DNA glycosylase
MSNLICVPQPKNFSFAHTVNGHGWSDLMPFQYDESSGTLNYVLRSSRSGKPISVCVRRNGRALAIEILSKGGEPDEVLQKVRHMLRIDDDLNDFYETVCTHETLGWVKKAKAGRLLRSQSVFEDLVKTMCTTNCSWGLTKIMTTNLVEKLGEPASDGKRAFPTPAAIASVSEAFFREEIRAGYRSPYFVELAESVASGGLDPEAWLVSALPTQELKKEIKKVKGIGDYAAENLLKLLGRYDGLALDSWLRAGFYKKHNREKACADKKIEKHYKKFGKWKGLAMWCDMTEGWFNGTGRNQT